jgi:hypothetical protein
MKLLTNLIQSTSPSVANGVGVGGVAAGGTGAALATWANTAQHLTMLVGFGVACAGLAGACFYAVYWAVKACGAVRSMRRGEEVK